MMGSWGARLAVQGLYTRAAQGPHPAASPAHSGRAASVLFLGAAAVVCSLPAWLASRNPDPELSTLELAACALWLVGFAGETTADRQLLRFVAKGEHDGLACRAGVWRYSRHADRIFTGLVWAAFAMFGVAAVWRP